MAPKPRASLQALQRRLPPLLRPYGVVRADLFGSEARGEAAEGSDLDLLVRFAEPKSLLELMDLEEMLSEALGRKVEIVTEAALSPHLRPIVEKEKVTLYEEAVG